MREPAFGSITMYSSGPSDVNTGIRPSSAGVARVVRVRPQRVYPPLAAA